MPNPTRRRSLSPRPESRHNDIRHPDDVRDRATTGSRRHDSLSEIARLEASVDASQQSQQTLRSTGLRFVASRRTAVEQGRDPRSETGLLHNEYSAASEVPAHGGAASAGVRVPHAPMSITTAESYDWGPDLPELQSPSSTWNAPQSPVPSTRRWRPSERLQDYASNYSRSGVSEGAAHQPQAQSVNSQGTASARRGQELHEHQDIVDRVERALEEYRLARRGLRAQQTTTIRPTGSHFDASSDSSTAADRLAITRGPSAAYRAFAARYGIDRSRHTLARPSHSHAESAGSFASGPLFAASSEALNYSPGLPNPPLSREAREARDSLTSLLDARRHAERLSRSLAAKSVDTRKAEDALRYLEALRDPDLTPEQAWVKASDLGLHNQGLREVECTNLPLGVHDLPKPAYSSWLEPGTIWSGVQSTKPSCNGKHGSASLDRDLRRRLPSRDSQNFLDQLTPQPGTSRPRVRLQPQGAAESLLDSPLPGLSAPTTTTNPEDFLTIARNNMQILEEAERDLTSMLERSERLLRENERQLRSSEAHLAITQRRLQEDDARLARFQFMANPFLRRAPSIEVTHSLPQKESWFVKVCLHEVNWDKMTLTGTMTSSSNAPTRPSHEQVHSDKSPSTSMESLFTGEIVDFETYGLETKSPKASLQNTRPAMYCPFDQPLRQSHHQQETWKVGGPEADLMYWAGIGPFKRAVDAAIEQHERDLGLVSTAQGNEAHVEDHGLSSPRSSLNGEAQDKSNQGDAKSDKLDSSTMSQTEKHEIKVRTMRSLLTDTEWLRANVNERGWILMRWKERCFVSPDDDNTPSSVPWFVGNNIQLSANVSSDTRTTQAPLNAGDSQRSVWGLTISGYYYIALNRQSGLIEGLYYDSGSAPFQTLKLGPCHPAVPSAEDEGPVNLQSTRLPGLRTNFSLVEFR